ncbi:MAG: acyltransferase family protein [Deinococcales bacterium]
MRPRTQAARAARLYYLDYLRAGVVALVFLHHTAITYGASGSWYFYDAAGVSGPIKGLLTVFAAFNQSWFMALLFFISGYLALASYNRKGPWRYVADRLRRFGIPLLVYAFVISPVTVWLAQLTNAGHPSLLTVYSQQRPFGFGVLWFVEALLIMDLLLVAWASWLRRGDLTARSARSFPRNAALVAFVFILGLASFAVRLGMPLGTTFAGLLIGYFPSYIAMFVLGIVAWRARWLDAIAGNAVALSRWLLIAGTLMVPVWLLGGGSGDAGARFAGGLHWQALVLAVWEQDMLAGMSITLLAWGRRRLNQPSRRWQGWAGASYLAYIIQPLIIVSAALAFTGLAWPALIKLLVVGTISVTAIYVVARVLRLVPVVRNVVG